MQRGGVQIKTQYTEEDALAYFMLNSTVRIFSIDSTDGIILTLTLNDGIESSYSTIRQCVVEDVRRMILKLVIITPNEVVFSINDKTKRYQELDITEFENEVAFQQQLFDSTHNLDIVEGQEMMDYSEAVCPCIIHSAVYGNNYDNGDDVDDESEHLSYLNKLKELLRDKTSYYNDRARLSHRNTINKIFSTLDIETSFQTETNEIAKEKVNKLGFIFMEFAEGYEQLSELIKSSDAAVRRNCRLISLLELSRVHDSNIIHNDLHEANILINYKKKRGMIIDFGRSKYTNSRNITIRNEWKPKLGANSLSFLLYDAFFEIMHYEQRQDFDKICAKNTSNGKKYFYLFVSYHWIKDILDMFEVWSFDNNCKISFQEKTNTDQYTHYSNLLSILIRERNENARLLECQPVLPTRSRRSISNLLSIRKVSPKPLVDEPDSDDEIETAIVGPEVGPEVAIDGESPPLDVMGISDLKGTPNKPPPPPQKKWYSISELTRIKGSPDERVIYPPQQPKKEWFGFLKKLGRGGLKKNQNSHKKHKPTTHKKQKRNKTKKHNKTKRNKTRRKQYKPKI